MLFYALRLTIVGYALFYFVIPESGRYTGASLFILYFMLENLTSNIGKNLIQIKDVINEMVKRFSSNM